MNLITDKPRPSNINYDGSDVYFEIDEDTSRSLREVAKELKVSLYTVLLGGYYLMLRAYSNQDDIVIGMAIANRHYSQIENLIGSFVNFLPIRCQINPEIFIQEFIKSLGSSIIEAQINQDLPFEKLVEELKVAKDTSRHPIFQIMFGVQSFGKANFSSLLEEYDSNTNLYNIAKFDFSTFIDDSGLKLKGSFL